jgi:hypothetical protein
MFNWESPNVWIKVRWNPARIMTLISVVGPQVVLMEDVSVEAMLVAN